MPRFDDTVRGYDRSKFREDPVDDNHFRKQPAEKPVFEHGNTRHNVGGYRNDDRRDDFGSDRSQHFDRNSGAQSRNYDDNPRKTKFVPGGGCGQTEFEEDERRGRYQSRQPPQDDRGRNDLGSNDVRSPTFVNRNAHPEHTRSAQPFANNSGNRQELENGPRFGGGSRERVYDGNQGYGKTASQDERSNGFGSSFHNRNVGSQDRSNNPPRGFDDQQTRGNFSSRDQGGFNNRSNDGYGNSNGRSYGERSDGNVRTSGYNRDEGGHNRSVKSYDHNEGGFNRNENGFNRNEGNHNRNESGFDRNGGGFNRNFGTANRNESDFNPRSSNDRYHNTSNGRQFNSSNDRQPRDSGFQSGVTSGFNGSNNRSSNDGHHNSNGRGFNERSNDNGFQNREGFNRFGNTGGFNANKNYGSSDRDNGGRFERGTDNIPEGPPKDWMPVEANLDDVAKSMANMATDLQSENNIENKDLKIDILNSDIDVKLTSWENSGLHPQIVKNLRAVNYHAPRPIQSAVIPQLLAGYDLIGQAETGGGKTCAFACPIINKILEIPEHERERQATNAAPYCIVLAPVRELAKQIYDMFKIYSKDCGIQVKLSYGQMCRRTSYQDILNGCHILVGTCGRIMDFIQKSHVTCDNLKFFVLDEADRLLEDVRQGGQHLNEIFDSPTFTRSQSHRQTLLFSATFNQNVDNIIRKLIKPIPNMNDPVRVKLSQGRLNPRVRLHFFETRGIKDKNEEVERLLSVRHANGKVPKTLIFVEQKARTDFCAIQFNKMGVKADSINGNRSQDRRESTLQDFRDGVIDVLVGTDVCSRGLDIGDLERVINFDLPKASAESAIDTFIHRVGRTGRVKKGDAYSFVNPSEPNDSAIISKLAELAETVGAEVPDFMKNHTSDSFNNFSSDDFKQTSGFTSSGFSSGFGQSGFGKSGFTTMRKAEETTDTEKNNADGAENKEEEKKEEFENNFTDGFKQEGSVKTEETPKDDDGQESESEW